MSDLTDHVADALFAAGLPMTEGDPPLGREDSEVLATVALQATRAQGWRIVKTSPHGRELISAQCEIVKLDEEWTGG